MKTIPLTHDQEALVDDADYGRLSKYPWYAMKCSGVYRAVRLQRFYIGEDDFKTKKQVLIDMGRQVLGMCTEDARDVDHIDRNPLNNCRSNLREATRQQNIWNKGKRVGRFESSYIGVCKNGNGKRWMARISGLDGKLQYLGTFDTEDQAALAYNVECLALRGEFAVLNDVA